MKLLEDNKSILIVGKFEVLAPLDELSASF